MNTTRQADVLAVLDDLLEEQGQVDLSTRVWVAKHIESMRIASPWAPKSGGGSRTQELYRCPLPNAHDVIARVHPYHMGVHYFWQVFAPGAGGVTLDEGDGHTLEEALSRADTCLTEYGWVLLGKTPQGPVTGG